MRLEDEDAKPGTVNLNSCFYSKLVRLEAAAVVSGRAKSRFLFQIGAIRSKSCVCGCSCSGRFLFQIGAIRRQLNGAKDKMSEKRFYSKLVRLEDVHHQRSSHILLMFLFQIGAIRSRRHIQTVFSNI